MCLQWKSRFLALLEQRMSVIRIAADIKITHRVVFKLQKAEASLSPGTVPPRKLGSGTPTNTSKVADRILGQEAVSNLAQITSELKKKAAGFAETLFNIA